MNANCYKVIFSKRTGTLVAVGEHTSAAGKAASGQTNRGVVLTDGFSDAMTHGFIGVLRLSFASVMLACLTLGDTQAQSSLPSIANNALPQGASVSTGIATINTTGAQMAITQSSDKASINWQSFNVGTGASVNIAQPNTTAVLLNRVVGNDPSQILGKLSANGQVVLLNPNGILFGKDGSVTASAFTASTFGLSDADFMNGYYKFNRNGSTASVVNQGTIEVSRGGYVALIGATVSNEGKIIATQGDLVMAAAESVTLPEELVAPKPNISSTTVSMRMSKRVRLELEPAAVNAAVSNTESGFIVTEGGQVLLQAAAISAAVASVTHSGNIETSAPQAGAVTLLAENGFVKVEGTIKSNSSGNQNGTTNRGGDIIIGRDEENGALSKTTDVSAAKLESSHGFVETSGQHIIVDGVQVKADQWLLDPTDITITNADSGIASTGTNPITLAPNTSGTTTSTINTSTLETNLSAGTNVIVKTTNAGGTGNGDITVASNIAVTGSSDATLTLQAERDIVINSNVNIARTGTNKLNVILNSDLDGNGAGAIVMNSGSSISTNGGSITLGGGAAGDGTGNAIGNATYNSGIALSSATLTAAGGIISLKGRSATTGTTDYASGISITGSSSITTTGAGDISLTGSSVATSGSQDTGIRIIGTSSSTLATITGGTTGSVTINGTATTASTSGSYQHGIQLQNVKASTTGGSISLTGTGGTTSGTSAGTGNNRGIAFESAAEVSATGAGTVTLTGVGGTGGPSATSANLGVSFNNTNNIKSESGAISINASAPDNTSYALSLGGTVASSSNGNITVTTDSISIGGTVSTGTGTVTVQNATAGTYITTGGATTDVRTTNPKTMVVDATELGKITASTTVIGRNDATGSGNVTVNAVNMGALGNTAGNLTVLGGNDITVSGAITKSTGSDATLNLSATNGVTVSANVGGTVAGAGKLNVSLTANGNAPNTANSKGITITKIINANGGAVSLTGTNKTSAGGNTNSGITFNGATIVAQTLTATGAQTGSNIGQNSNGIYFTNSNALTTSSGVSTLTGSSNALGNFGGGLYLDDNASLTLNSGTGSIQFAGTNSNNGYRGIRIGTTTNTTLLNATGNISFEDTGFQTFLRGQLTLNSNTTVSLKGKAAQIYAGGVIQKAAGATGTTLNLDASTVTVGDSAAGSASITADTINLIGNSTSTGSIDVQILKGSTVTSTGVTNVTTSGLGTTALNSDADTTIAATGGLVVNIGKAGTLRSLITGGTANAGGLTKQGAGTLSLTNANTLNGNTLVSTGTLALNNINAIQNSTLNTGTSGSQLVTFGVTGTNTYNIGGLQGEDAIAIGANAINVGSNNSTTTYSGVISGSGNLTKLGTGNLTLSGQSTKTGNYNANAGTLTLTGASNNYRSLSGVNVNINNGATVSIPSILNGGFVSENVTWTFGSAGGGLLDINTNFVNRGVNGNKFVTTGGATNTVNGNINLDANGGGSGPSFEVAAGTAGVAGLIHAGNTTNGNTSQSLTKTGAGTLILTGTNDYKGAIAINSGTLQVGNGGTTGTLGSNSGTVTVASGATFNVNRSNALTLANTISGAGQFGQMGSGTTTLTADNSYSGTTTISGGTLQVGASNTTGRIGTGAVTLSNNSNLNFVRAATTQISNDISGTGNLNATITGSSSDLTLSGTTNITGAINLSATGSILTTAAKNITSTSGVSLAGQNGVTLNANITNNSSGAISIRAGDNTTTSTASINTGSGVTITQNAAAAVTMTTDALGDLTVAKIIKGSGAGDITVASGIKLSAGVAGGDVKTTAGNSITNNGTGKTLIYTGSSAESGLMSNLNAALATLYLNPIVGQTQNAASRTTYGLGGGLAGGPAAQVLFREAADVTASISGATMTKNYGDAAPTTAALISALTAANNGATTSATSAAGTLVVSTADAISDIANHASVDATNNSFGRLNANATGYAYTTSGSGYSADGASPNLTLIVNKVNAVVSANSDTSKIYNGLTQTVTGFTATGLLSGETENVLTGVTANGSGTNVGTYISTATGTDVNYNLSFTNGSLIIGKANLSALGTKIYDASSAFSGSNFTSITGVNGETFTATGSGSLASANVQSNQALSSLGSLSLTGVGGALTSNYNNLSAAQTSVSVTPRALSVTGANTSSTYSGSAQTNAAATITGAQGSDTFTVSGYGTGTHASTSAYADTLSLTGNGSTALSNYNITYTNGGLTIGKANLSALGTKIYDASSAFSGTSFTSITGVNGETFTATGSGSLTSANVQSNQTLSSLGSLSLTGVGGALTSNYNNLSAAQTSVSVTPAALTVTGTNSTSTYSGLTQTNSSATITGAQGSDTFTVSGYGTGTYASTSAYADTLSLTGNGSTSLSNYNITYTNGSLTIGKANLSALGTKIYDASSAFSGSNFTSITGVNGETFTATGSGSLASANVQSNQALSSLGSLSLTGVGGALTSNYNNLSAAQTSVSVTPRALSVTGANTSSTYSGSAQTNAAATITGAQGSDTFTVSGYGTGTHASTSAYADALSLTGNGSTALSNYNITYTHGGLTIGKANLTLSGTRTYDAGTTFAGVHLTATGVNSETFSVLGLGDASNLASKNVQTNQSLSSITGLSLGSSSNGGLTNNYNILSTAGSAVNITPAALTVTGANNTTTYNGFTQTNSGATVAGNLGADAFNVTGYGYGTNASTTAYADSLSVTPANGSTSLSNYNITYTNGSLAIDKAALTIKANNDARFVGQADRVGFDGVSYIGLVGAETNSVLSGTLSIARQNANTDVSAGTYSGVLTPSGLTSTNYNISYVSGDYTIVPADTLLIRTTSQNLTYGSTPTFTTVAEYLDSQDNLIHTLTQSGSANMYTFSDGARGSASLTLKPYTSTNTVAATSTSGNIVVGSYQVYADDTTIVGNNFIGSPVFTGTLNVTAKPVTATVNNVTKTYDSTTSMSNTTVNLNGGVAEDNLTVSGSGIYGQKNAGQGLNYTISNITLSGADVANYFLNGADTITASNGIITPAPLVLSTTNVTKNYDGSTSAAGTLEILDGTQLFGNDILTGANFAFTDPSVGLGNKVVNVTNAVISDGNGGSNYAVRYVSNTTSSITGLNTSKNLSLLAQPKDLGLGLNDKHPANTPFTSAFYTDPAITVQGLENCKSATTSGCVCTSQSGDSNGAAAICAPSDTSDLGAQSQLMHEQNTREVASLARDTSLAD